MNHLATVIQVCGTSAERAVRGGFTVHSKARSERQIPVGRH